jgi:hypothetical protein
MSNRCMCCAKNQVARKRNCNKKNYVILYSGHKSEKHEFGTRFYIGRHI